MKKILIPSIFVSLLFANEENYLELGFASMQSKDNFSVQAQKNITSLTSAKSENEVLPYLAFNYTYTYNKDLKLYLQSKLEDIRLGSQMNTSYGLFNFGLKADVLSEEWKNPFLTSTKREKTKTKELGAYFSYNLPLWEVFETTLKYEISKKTYDKDEVSEHLKREGTKNIFALENMYYMKEDLILLNTIEYENYSAKGQANSYNSYTLGFGALAYLKNDLELSVIASYAQKKYDKKNQEVNKRVKSNNIQIIGSLKVNNLLENKNLYSNLSLGIEEENANADFYDKKNVFSLLSLGYKF